MSKFSEGGGAINWDQFTSSAPGSLGSQDLTTIASKIDAARTRGFRVLKLKGHAHVAFMDSDEHIVFGVAGPGLSGAEIEEAIESDPQSPQDNVNIELSMRPVWPLGILGGSTDLGGSPSASFEETIRWSFPQGQAMLWWVYNTTASTLNVSTTFSVVCKIFGVWLRD